MIKLVLTDIDGTLIPLGVQMATKRAMRAIESLKASGIVFGLATGRDLVELDPKFGGKKSLYSSGILSNGKRIMLDGEVVQLSLIQNEPLERLSRLIAEYPNAFLTAYPLRSAPNNPVYCVGASKEEIARWAKIYAFTGIVEDHVPELEVIGSTIACSGDESTMVDIIEKGRELCPEFDFVRPAANWTDVVPKGVNKGSALPILLDAVGATMDEVVMFGDAGNDLAILQAVTHSVAVSNATPEVKSIARWHIGAAEDDAVAVAFEHLAKGNGCIDSLRVLETTI